MDRKNKYIVEDVMVLHSHLIILIKDLETNTIFEINDETLKNNSSNVDKLIYKTVKECFSNYLLYKSFDRKYIKNVTK